MMKKFEILKELPKCDLEIWSDKWCWENETCSVKGCHKPSVYKKHSICKAQWSKHYKTKAACSWKGQEIKHLT